MTIGPGRPSNDVAAVTMNDRQAARDRTRHSGYRVAERILQGHGSPTVIFAAKDSIAVAVAHRDGLDVPRHSSVAGFDDVSIETTLWPELATVYDPVADIPGTAVELLTAPMDAERAGGRGAGARPPGAGPLAGDPRVRWPAAVSDRPLRSRDWLANAERSDMTALHLERLINYGMTAEEFRSGHPIDRHHQWGSSSSPGNRVHLDLAQRVKDGVRDAGGVPLESPVHPISKNCRRSTAALNRDLLCLGLVELFNGYRIDGVVLTTGCDEAALVGSGTVIWRSRRKLAAGGDLGAAARWATARQ